MPSSSSATEPGSGNATGLGLPSPGKSPEADVRLVEVPLITLILDLSHYQCVNMNSLAFNTVHNTSSIACCRSCGLAAKGSRNLRSVVCSSGVGNRDNALRYSSST